MIDENNDTKTNQGENNDSAARRLLDGPTGVVPGEVRDTELREYSGGESLSDRLRDSKMYEAFSGEMSGKVGEGLKMGFMPLPTGLKEIEGLLGIENAMKMPAERREFDQEAHQSFLNPDTTIQNGSGNAHVNMLESKSGQNSFLNPNFSIKTMNAGKPMNIKPDPLGNMLSDKADVAQNISDPGQNVTYPSLMNFRSQIAQPVIPNMDGNNVQHRSPLKGMPVIPQMQNRPIDNRLSGFSKGENKDRKKLTQPMPSDYQRAVNFPPFENNFQTNNFMPMNFPQTLSGEKRPSPSDISQHMPQLRHIPGIDEDPNTINVKLIYRPQNSEFTMKIQKHQVKTLDTLLQSLESNFESQVPLQLFYESTERMVQTLDELTPDETFILDVFENSGINPMGQFSSGIQGIPPSIPYTHYRSQSPGPDLLVDQSYKHLLETNPPLSCLSEKLPASKTPVIEAFVYCALAGWGVQINYIEGFPYQFAINDFATYWDFQIQVCSKPTPTKQEVARLKSLRRWFLEFPGIKKLKATKNAKSPLVFSVKPEKRDDLTQMVKKVVHIINTRCRAVATTQYQNLIPQNVQNTMPQFSNNYSMPHMGYQPDQ